MPCPPRSTCGPTGAAWRRTPSTSGSSPPRPASEQAGPGGMREDGTMEMEHRFDALRLRARSLARLARRFVVDRMGGTAVQAMAFLPLIIISTFGLFKAWEIVQVRESLHTASYEAVR